MSKTQVLKTGDPANDPSQHHPLVTVIHLTPPYATILKLLLQPPLVSKRAHALK